MSSCHDKLEMRNMEVKILDNINEIVRDGMKSILKNGSKFLSQQIVFLCMPIKN